MSAAIFVLVGSPAVGKTTTAQALAERFDRGVSIRVDGFHELVVSGFVFPDDAWGPDVALQVRCARESAIATARIFAGGGYTVVLDDFWDPFELPEYDALFSDEGVHGVLVYPSQAEAHRRNRDRGINADYIEWGIDWVYRNLDAASAPQRLAERGWLILDNTSIDVGAAVDLIIAHAGTTSERFAPGTGA